MEPLTNLAIEHLLLRLQPLHRALRCAVRRQVEIGARLQRSDLTPFCITDEQVASLLADVDALVETAGHDAGATAALTTTEQQGIDALRAAARASNLRLPLDAFAEVAGLTALEEDVVLLCAAPELDRAYERIYAYILDDLNRRFPCIELLCAVTMTPRERLFRRADVGNVGRLVRSGILRLHGEAPTELRQELRLGTGVLGVLLGRGGDIGLFRDRDDAHGAPSSVDAALHVDAGTIARTIRQIADGTVEVVGIWGPRHAGHADVVRALAGGAHRPLLRCTLADMERPGADPETVLREKLQRAGAERAMLWIPVEGIADPGHERVGDLLSELLACSTVPLCLTGSLAWRPTRLLAARRYTELELEAPSYHARRALWNDALPELGPTLASELAARFHVGAEQVRAAARGARTVLSQNGDRPDRHQAVVRVVGKMIRKRTSHLATLVTPRRGPNDLILPPELHAQILEVGRFFSAWPRVSEEWGFGHLASGDGMKVLFTGESGTGKTLAAEVIAGMLDLPLLRVDLARVVSKWVGETEKNLDAVFNEAADCHACLFADEAESLFGSRAQVSHGTDRYANLEISYLLQRIEEHPGLVILATNLRDLIDAAFTRRFQIVLHFPRPEVGERRRLWRLAFPPAAPIDPGVDFELLAQLDMTGGGIVNAARTAALLAIEDATPAITMAHVVRGVARQFRRESRVLTAGQLGPHAPLLASA